MRLRFVDGRPVSAVTTLWLGGLPTGVSAAGQTALWLGWDKASWHVSQAVRAWLKTPHRRVKRAGGCRLVVCPLPSTRPWLNRLEPKGVHGERAMAEPDRKVHVDELKQRSCAYYDGERRVPIAQ